MAAPVTQQSDFSVTFKFEEPDPLYTTCTINNISFAFLHQPICQEYGSFHLKLKNHCLIILSPIAAERDVRLQAASIIILNAIHSETAKINLVVSDKLIDLWSEDMQEDDQENYLLKYKQRFIALPTCEERESIAQTFTNGILTKDPVAIITGLFSVVDIILQKEKGQQIHLFECFKLFGIKL